MFLIIFFIFIFGNVDLYLEVFVVFKEKINCYMVVSDF